MNDIKATCEASLKISVAGVSFLSAFFTTIDLMFFLSKPNYNETNMQGASQEIKWTAALIINSILLSLFALQHSILAMQSVKDAFARYNMKDIQRCIYVIFTCVILELAMNNWKYTSTIKLWEFAMDHSIACFYYSTHVFCWLLIYIGSVCMDINELLGIKQVYYSIQQLPDPLTYKSPELKQLYTHMRHPSFIGFIAILWCVPVMRLDRLFLAAFLTLYMYIAWKTDNRDLIYQRYQIRRKFN